VIDYTTKTELVMDTVVNTVEDVKHKLTDAEYKAIMDGLMEVHNSNSNSQASVVVELDSDSEEESALGEYLESEIRVLTHLLILERERLKQKTDEANRAWSQVQSQALELAEARQTHKQLHASVCFWSGRDRPLN